MIRSTTQTSRDALKRPPHALVDQIEEWAGPAVAVFWDQSLVWGIICLETMKALGVPFRLLSGKEIAAGALEGYRVLIVPGGWAAHKVRALGEAGKTRLKQFVQSGGSYLGFCGGAGLALSSPPSLGLVPLRRMLLSERLPNASGEIWIQGVPEHPIWEGLPPALPVSIWWPSQFMDQSLSESLCLATYMAPGAGFWVADLPLSDLQNTMVPWNEWEKIYGINLNPTRLLGHVAMIEARSGKGTLILSYPHLETPGDGWANRLFSRCLHYLDQKAGQHLLHDCLGENVPATPMAGPGKGTLKHIREAREAAQNLIEFGERHLLWQWRHSWLLNWRRGIRGLEYGTLAVVLGHLFGCLDKLSAETKERGDPWLETAKQIKEQVIGFCRLAGELLMEEKLATQTRNLTKLGEINATVDLLRTRLFGHKMNHGGLCRDLFDHLDGFLLEVLRAGEKSG
jgi:hypothetical protein